MKYVDIEITQIKVSERSRKAFGDLSGLIASIQSIVLLHPIVLGPNNVLIAGGRRLAAFKALGLFEIPATVLDDIRELGGILQAERDENVQRLDLLPSEAVSIGLEIEKRAAEEARDRQLSGKSADGEAGGRGRKT